MFSKIRNLPLVNEVDESKVQALVESMLANGWQGAPILYVADTGLVTGSHRLAALQRLEEMQADADDARFDRISEILSSPVALDVSDIVNAFCAEYDYSFDELDFSSLRPIFAGTEVEAYADQIEEW